MGYRLTKIYTRTGDTGTTGLGDGARVSKSGARIHAIGDVDELNSVIGVLLAEPVDEDIAAVLLDIQHGLFDLGGELSMPGYALVGAAHVAKLEAAIDGFNAELPPLRDFILPGGGRANALAHLARGICRRAERAVVALAETEAVNEHGRTFLNRASDLLFVLARSLARRGGHAEVLWQKGRFERR